jgi:hypothetical protein
VEQNGSLDQIVSGEEYARRPVVRLKTELTNRALPPVRCRCKPRLGPQARTISRETDWPREPSRATGGRWGPHTVDPAAPSGPPGQTIENLSNNRLLSALRVVPDPVYFKSARTVPAYSLAKEAF